MRRLPARPVYYGLNFVLRMPTWVVMAVYLVQELHFSPLQLVLMGTAMEATVFLFEIPTGVVSLRAGVILGGAFTIVCGLAAILFMPETGFRRRPRAERGSALAELHTTALAGVRYAWAAPVIVLLIGAELFMGASSEAFDR